MNLKRRAIGAVVVGIASAAPLVLGAGPALAAGYDLSGTLPAGQGGAAATGTIRFTGERTFTWTGSLRDLCPADGHGAEVQFVVRHMDGSQSVRTGVLKNESGCKSAAVKGSGSIADKKRIKNVMIVLYSTTDRKAWVTLDLSATKDNPKT